MPEREVHQINVGKVIEWLDSKKQSKPVEKFETVNGIADIDLYMPDDEPFLIRELVTERGFNKFRVFGTTAHIKDLESRGVRFENTSRR